MAIYRSYFTINFAMDMSCGPKIGRNKPITGMMGRSNVDKGYFAGGRPSYDGTTGQDIEFRQGHTDSIYTALRSERKRYS